MTVCPLLSANLSEWAEQAKAERLEVPRTSITGTWKSAEKRSNTACSLLGKEAKERDGRCRTHPIRQVGKAYYYF